MSAACYHWRGEKLILSIRIQPNAAKNELADIKNDELKVRIAAPPVEGKANDQLIRFLAKVFKVRQADIKLIHGLKGRSKCLAIDHPRFLPAFIKGPGQV